MISRNNHNALHIQNSKIAAISVKHYYLFLIPLIWLWPLYIHGQPFQFTDTTSYFRSGKAIFDAVSTIFSPLLIPVQQPPDSLAVPADGRMILYGRSIYFGSVLYLFYLTKSLVAFTVVTALASALVIIGAIRHVISPNESKRFNFACLLTFAAATFTTLPYFIGFLMPDIWVGLALFSVAILVIGWRREPIRWRAFYIGIILWAALSHSSILPVLAVLGLGLLLLYLRQRKPENRHRLTVAIILIGLSIAGIAGDIAFAAATRHATGSAPVRPPFLTARLIGDGPARTYLEHHCHKSHFTLCRYPLQGNIREEIFLWSEVRPLGGFKALPTVDAKAVAAEQMPFIWAVFSTYPIETIKATVSNIFKQISRISLMEFNQQPPTINGPDLAVNWEDTIAPVSATLKAANDLIILLGKITIPFCLLYYAIVSRRMKDVPATKLFTVLILLILLNDIICATLSGPFPRYQSRILWSIPLATLFLWLSQRRQGLYRPNTAPNN